MDSHRPDAKAHVSASGGGVEILSEPNFTLQPVEARNYAALLVRSADEVERMRDRRVVFRDEDNGPPYVVVPPTRQQ